MRAISRTAITIFLTALVGLAAQAQPKRTPLPRLKVSSDKRFLLKADNTPFFYLGDTAWEFFHRLNRKEAAMYLRKRAEQKYTVIQAVAVADWTAPPTPTPTATCRSSTTIPRGPR